jgi:Predicted phosphohydrolases
MMKISLFAIHIIVWGGWLTVSASTMAQPGHQPETLYFLSDCQEPMKAEKLFLKPFRNTEARDSLFSDIIRHEPGQMFLLGDLVSEGSKKRKWLPIQQFIRDLHSQNTKIHAIPGNHEYYIRERKGIARYERLFPDCPLYGYCIRVDSVAVVMLNSNTAKLPGDSLKKQMLWYRNTMDVMDADPGVRVILVCTHHAPFTNSKVVEPSGFVADSIVPRFMQSAKAKLFISGHSHNLEYFQKGDKHFLVAGGGGGLIQPLYPPEKRKFTDLIAQEKKPLYFYIMVKRAGSNLQLSVRGLDRNFIAVRDFPVDFVN